MSRRYAAGGVTVLGLLALGGALWWARSTAVARSVARQDVLASRTARQYAAGLMLADLIATPPGSGLDARAAGEQWHALYTSGTVPAGMGYRLSTWRPDSVWGEGVLARVRPALGRGGPGARVRWVTLAARGGWKDAQRDAVRHLPFLSGYGELVAVARTSDLDVIGGRFDSLPPTQHPMPLLPSEHFEHLLDALALTSASLIADDRRVEALAPLADGVHVLARWATRTPDPIEAARALAYYDEFRRAYLIAVNASGWTLAGQLQATADSMMMGVPDAARPSVWFRPSQYLDAVGSDTTGEDMIWAAAYVRGKVRYHLHFCRIGGLGEDPRRTVRFPGEASWPRWGLIALRPTAAPASCRTPLP